MPVVLTEVGGKARSGHLYDDRSGVSYEYPTRYERLIRPGESFVYHRPRVGYVGCGVIGTITPSIEPGRLVCAIDSPVFFDHPVPFKDSNGTDLEAPMSSTGKVFYQQGVRPISDAVYQRIVEEGAALAPGIPNGRALWTNMYADPKDGRDVELYAVSAAQDWLETRYPGTRMIVMPHNNPGYDIRLDPTEGSIRYVEVKGTRSAVPRFFVTEGERLFSVRFAGSYTLVVVYGINLAARTHAGIADHDGGLDLLNIPLTAHQWSGLIG